MVRARVRARVRLGVRVRIRVGVRVRVRVRLGSGQYSGVHTGSVWWDAQGETQAGVQLQDAEFQCDTSTQGRTQCVCSMASVGKVCTNCNHMR